MPTPRTHIIYFSLRFRVFVFYLSGSGSVYKLYFFTWVFFFIAAAVAAAVVYYIISVGVYATHFKCQHRNTSEEVCISLHMNRYRYMCITCTRNLNIKRKL